MKIWKKKKDGVAKLRDELYM